MTVIFFNFPPGRHILWKKCRSNQLVDGGSSLKKIGSYSSHLWSLLNVGRMRLHYTSRENSLIVRLRNKLHNSKKSLWKSLRATEESEFSFENAELVRFFWEAKLLYQRVFPSVTFSLGFFVCLESFPIKVINLSLCNKKCFVHFKIFR